MKLFFLYVLCLIHGWVLSGQSRRCPHCQQWCVLLHLALLCPLESHLSPGTVIAHCEEKSLVQGTRLK